MSIVYRSVDHSDKDSLVTGEYFVTGHRGKFKNKPVWACTYTWGLVRFDSILEFEVAQKLEDSAEEGYVDGLERQIAFVVAPAIEQVNERGQVERLKPITYRADFVYWDVALDCRVIVDVKGRRDKLFDLKWHLLKGEHGMSKEGKPTTFVIWYKDRQEITHGGGWR